MKTLQEAARELLNSTPCGQHTGSHIQVRMSALTEMAEALAAESQLPMREELAEALSQACDVLERNSWQSARTSTGEYALSSFRALVARMVQS